MNRNTNISFTIPMELLQKIDSFRGDIPRSRFILRIMESNFNIRSNDDQIKVIPVGDSYHATDQQAKVLSQ